MKSIKRDTTILSRGAQKRETRQRLLDAAIRVFARDGIRAATTSDVAAEAGVSHGSVFVHFGTQNGLIEAAIELFGGMIAKRLHEEAARGASVREVLRAYLDCLGEQEDFYARLTVEAPMLPASARDSLIGIQAAIAIHLLPAIGADAAAGRIKDLSPPLLFNTWVGLLNYYVANRDLFAPGTSVINRRGEELIEHFLALIAKGD